MKTVTNDLFNRMCNEAIDELASGRHGSWREVPSNTLFLAAFGMLRNHLVSKITKPLWFFAGSVFAGVIAYIAVQIITNGGD